MMKKLLLLLLVAIVWQTAAADEGMWMLGSLSKQTRREMVRLGLELPVKKLYDPRRPSLKDAVVSFGGFCSGVVVSDSGLVLTNHHCGFGSVQQLSSVDADYVKYGFAARERGHELPCPELYVRFLVEQTDVTRRVMRALNAGMSEMERSAAVDSMRMLIADEVMRKDTSLVAMVDVYYGGNEFWLSTYRDYNDVRLVFSPPSFIGKFGWDQDNWMWPRHTGDFCVFRIYADSLNRPADYSPSNVPFRPPYVAPLSLKGYDEGSFCMTLGYPGSTDRYLSSYGIGEMMSGQNQAQIDVRTLKQAIWKRAMERSDSIRLMYASKYDQSSNYWKNSIGMNRALRKLDVIAKKRQMEQEVSRAIARSHCPVPDADTLRRRLADERLHLFTNLELAYKERRVPSHAQAYFVECFLNGSELLTQALTLLNFDFEGEQKDVIAGLKKVVETYQNIDVDTDKEVFTALTDYYRTVVPADYLPAFYANIDTLHGGHTRAFADSIYAHTQLASTRGLERFLEGDTTYHIYDDPAISLSLDLINTLYYINMQMHEPSLSIERYERLYQAEVRQLYAERNYYPDANSTLRLSFGTVGGYVPADGAYYDYYTTSRGIIEKAFANVGDADFEVYPDYFNLLCDPHSFDGFTNARGELPVCFITNNDITGGNSGSAMFNARGELLGLAFDGNWETMSGDILFEPRTQRTIGVDIRYILYVMQRYAGSDALVNEMLR